MWYDTQISKTLLVLLQGHRSNTSLRIFAVLEEDLVKELLVNRSFVDELASLLVIELGIVSIKLCIASILTRLIRLFRCCSDLILLLFFLLITQLREYIVVQEH